MGQRQCPYCGKFLPDTRTQCPHCLEVLSQVRVAAHRRPFDGKQQIRRGVLYMALGAIFYYFAAGYSTLKFPFTIPSPVNDYLAPLLFLGGLGLTLYGLYRRFRG